jgi:hypothetical protein
VGYLTASLNTAKLRGKIGKGISVYTNDPNTSHVRLALRAVVLGSVAVLPREHIMIGGPADRSGGSKVLVRQDPTETGELQISDLQASLPWLSAEAHRLEDPMAAAGGLPKGEAGDWLLEVKIADRSQARTGHARAELHFKTGLKRQPEVSIPITVDLRPPVNLSVPRLVFEKPAEGEVAEKTILATVRRGLDANKLEVETGTPSIVAELEPSGPRRFKVHFTWTGGELKDASILFKVGSESHHLPVKVAPGVSPGVAAPTGD